jgi:hypothetical protein
LFQRVSASSGRTALFPKRIARRFARLSGVPLPWTLPAEANSRAAALTLLWPSLMMRSISGKSARSEAPKRSTVPGAGPFRRRRAVPVPAGVGPGVIGLRNYVAEIDGGLESRCRQGWRWCSGCSCRPVALCQDTLCELALAPIDLEFRGLGHQTIKPRQCRRRQSVKVPNRFGNGLRAFHAWLSGRHEIIAE